MNRMFKVIRMRLERMTVCLEGRCSIQLSYRTNLLRCKDSDFLLYLQILNKVGDDIVIFSKFVYQ